MKQARLLYAAIAVVIICISWNHNYIKTSRLQTAAVFAMAEPDSSGDITSILPQVRLWNGNPMHAPKTQFRKGHVSFKNINNYFTKTEYGYMIKLPSSTNIPTPSVFNNTLYVSGGFGSKEYFAFDAVTGNLKWGTSLDDDGPSAAAIQDSTIVFNTESCTIFACDAITGVQKWSYWLGDPLMSMPTIANGLVFTAYPAPYGGPLKTLNDSLPVQRPSHVLIAIELHTGKIVWQRWIDSDIMSAPVAKDDKLYFTTFSGGVYTVEQQTGEITEAKGARATSAPVFGSASHMIYSRRADDVSRDTMATEALVVTGYGAVTVRGSSSFKSIYKKQAEYLDHKVQSRSKLKMASTSLDAGNGFAGGAPVTANWQAGFANIGQSNVSSLQSFQGSRALYHQGKIFNTMGDEVLCTDTSGATLWKHKLTADVKAEGGFGGTPPIYCGGLIIVATLNGEVLLFEAASGKLAQSYELKEPLRYQPVASNGWIYVTSVAGRLHAINTGNPQITGWPVWGANAARTNVVN